MDCILHIDSSVPSPLPYLLLIPEDSSAAEVAANMSWSEGDWASVNTDDFGGDDCIHYASAFSINENDEAVFDLATAKSIAVGRITLTTTDQYAQYGGLFLISQASLAEGDRLPGVQAVFDAVNLKFAAYTTTVDNINAATNISEVQALVEAWDPNIS